MSEKAYKPTLALDFDGVIHSYTSGWTSADYIADDMVDGFFAWAEEADKYFKLVIYSSRSKSAEAREAMQRWMDAQYLKQGVVVPRYDKMFTFSAEKPAAFITIDDRAITFNGDWADPCFAPAELLKFKPWNKQ